MAHYLCPSDGSAAVAMSLGRVKRGVGTDVPGNGTNGMGAARNGTLETDENLPRKPHPYANNGGSGNPTVLPEEVLRQFQFVFLIRNPILSLPSYYRCTIPPLDAMTGFNSFMPSEAGYRELRLVFDHLRTTGYLGHESAEKPNGTSDEDRADICVIDADDLLDNPSGMIQAFCKSVGLDYEPSMLKWDTPAHQRHARSTFAKWRGFHEDAIGSTEFKPRAHVSRVQSARAPPELLLIVWQYRKRSPNPRRSTTPSGSRNMDRMRQTCFGRPWIRTWRTINISSNLPSRSEGKADIGWAKSRATGGYFLVA